MSKGETPMVEAYWQSVGGLLVEEFQAVPPSLVTSGRWVDSLILPARERRRFRWPHVPPGFAIDCEEVIDVQAKAKRLNMPVMGQALFSAELVKLRFRPSRVRAVALCTKDDAALRALLAPFGIEAVVLPEFVRERDGASAGRSTSVPSRPFMSCPASA